MAATTAAATAASATARIQPKKQTLDDAYAPPANFLEIDVVSPETHGVGKKRYTDYEIRMKVKRGRTRSHRTQGTAPSNAHLFGPLWGLRIGSYIIENGDRGHYS